MTNPEASANVERIYQEIGNNIRNFELEENYLGGDDPWKDSIISATSFAVTRSTYHTTLQKTPGQLVFNRDMVFNIQLAANWKTFRQRIQNLINKNNNKERTPKGYLMNTIRLGTLCYCAEGMKINMKHLALALTISYSKK